LIESRDDRPDRIRVRALAELPAMQSGTVLKSEGDARLRYAARFEDVDAALMHAHNALRRRLIDVDRRLYRTDPIEAVAAVDAIDLPHRRVHLDATLAGDDRLTARIARRRAGHERDDRIWTGIGAAALLFLAALMLFGT